MDKPYLYLDNLKQSVFLRCKFMLISLAKIVFFEVQLKRLKRFKT